MSVNVNSRAVRERIVREHMDAENALDMDRALDTFAHPRYEIMATGEIYDGPDDVSGYYRQSRAVFPDQRNELISLRHADDAVIVEFWLLGTHKGPLGRLEPTGREFKCRMTAFFIFEGTGLVCERAYFDSATIRRQLTG
jgi:predicted ester cyclase